MKAIISFIVSLVICALFFIMLDFALMKAQGLDLIPEKKVEGKK
jgi:hypothetical protein